MLPLSLLLPARWRPYNIIAKRWKDNHGNVIGAGPFKGVRYIDESSCSAFPPKLIGCYELELHDLIEAEVRRAPEHIIDIGAAEGYYAIGLAKRCPHSHIIAFEANDHARDLLSTMVALNEVEQQVEVRGLCTLNDLQDTIGTKNDGLLVCDVEGAELELLDPQQILQLATWHLLIELHEFIVPNITQIIVDRFRSSHEITHIMARERNSKDIPSNLRSLLFNRWAVVLLGEHRPKGMSWLHLSPLLKR